MNEDVSRCEHVLEMSHGCMRMCFGWSRQRLPMQGRMQEMIFRMVSNVRVVLALACCFVSVRGRKRHSQGV